MSRGVHHAARCLVLIGVLSGDCRVRIAALHSNSRRGFEWGGGDLPNDPLFSQQWYYDNHQISNHDAEVLAVWRQGVNGSGVVVCIVDDGIEHDHTDLRDA